MLFRDKAQNIDDIFIYHILCNFSLSMKSPLSFEKWIGFPPLFFVTMIPTPINNTLMKIFKILL